MAWVQLNSAGARNWTSIAASSDGTKVVATVSGGKIWRSTDSGVTWGELTNAVTGQWNSITSSADGVKLAACRGAGYIHTSTDSGATWVQSYGASAKTWSCISGNSTGTILLAAEDGNLEYSLALSTNSGASWSLITSLPAFTYFSCAVSSNGQKMIICDNGVAAGGGLLYTSIDSGVTWVLRAGGAKRVAISGDGTKMVRARNNLSGLGYVEYSTDNGANWTQDNFLGSRVWSSISISNNGLYILANVQNSPVYLSTNGGTSWTQQTDLGNVSWRFSVITQTGLPQYIVRYGYYIYSNPLPDVTIPTPGNSGTITISDVTSSSLTLNWTKATDNVSSQANLQYLAYRSTSSSFDTLGQVEAGTAIGTYAADINTKAVTGLSGATTYYFNVVVKDEANNRAVYTKKMQATLENVPPVPGNSGTITTSGVGANAVTLNWTAATDNVDAPSSLLYRVYYSTNPNLSTVQEIKDNGTAFGEYA